MVLFGSGMSYGHSHANSNLPILLAGGRGLGLRHGRHLDYNHPKGYAYTLSYDEWLGLCGKPKDGKARLSNVMLTMLQKMGVATERFVDSTGPVSEVWRDPGRRLLAALAASAATAAAAAGRRRPAGSSACWRRRTSSTGRAGSAPARPAEIVEFALTPDAAVEYLDADADLRDLPLGTAYRVHPGARRGRPVHPGDGRPGPLHGGRPGRRHVPRGRSQPRRRHDPRRPPRPSGGDPKEPSAGRRPSSGPTPGPRSGRATRRRRSPRWRPGTSTRQPGRGGRGGLRRDLGRPRRPGGGHRPAAAALRRVRQGPRPARPGRADRGPDAHAVGLRGRAGDLRADLAGRQQPGRARACESPSPTTSCGPGTRPWTTSGERSSSSTRPTGRPRVAAGGDGQLHARRVPPGAVRPGVPGRLADRRTSRSANSSSTTARGPLPPELAELPGQGVSRASTRSAPTTAMPTCPGIGSGPAWPRRPDSEHRVFGELLAVGADRRSGRFRLDGTADGSRVQPDPGGQGPLPQRRRRPRRHPGRHPLPVLTCTRTTRGVPPGEFRDGRGERPGAERGRLAGRGPEPGRGDADRRPAAAGRPQ